MSKEALDEIAGSVAQKLSGSGLLRLGTVFSETEDSRTDGWSCYAEPGDVSLELFLDGWMHGPEKELYYGVFSERRAIVDEVAKLFDDEPFTIGNNDELDVGGSDARLKPAIAGKIGQRFIVHHSRRWHWFGRYAITSSVVEEAASFFEVVLQRRGGDGYPEGACRQVTTDRYERDPAARAACLQVHGYSCQICTFDFESTYGVELGRLFIHVHHLTPLAKGERMTDSAKHLIPVCPNCHAMLHRRNPPVDPDELRARINR